MKITETVSHLSLASWFLGSKFIFRASCAVYHHLHCSALRSGCCFQLVPELLVNVSIMLKEKQNPSSYNDASGPMRMGICERVALSTGCGRGWTVVVAGTVGD